MHSVSTQYTCEHILRVVKAIKIEINRFNIKYGGANEIAPFYWHERLEVREIKKKFKLNRTQ